MQRETEQKDRIKIALLAAVVAHGLLLILMPGVNVQVNEFRKSLYFTLVLPNQAAPRRVLLPKSEAIPHAPLPQDMSSVADNLAEPEALPLTMPALINQQVLNAWAKSETQQHLHTQPEVIAQFKQTFADPITKFAEPIQSYSNVFGEQHVITRLNGRDVCYLQGVPAVSDDWTVDVVMFYDCHQDPKFAISLR